MTTRDRADRCPGVLRPWIADDGALVRLRLVGGRLPTESLSHLVRISAEHADGDLHLTSRANLQLRAIAHDDGCVSPAFVEAVTEAGLLPSPTHELVRNIMVSPLSGRVGGRADLRPAADRFDELLRADPDLAGLSARFLVVLDDGRGDLADRSLDLGAMAVDADSVQLRIGSEFWGEVIGLDDLPESLIVLAQRFLEVRGKAPGGGAGPRAADNTGGGAGPRAADNTGGGAGPRAADDTGGGAGPWAADDTGGGAGPRAAENAVWHVDELPDRGSDFAQPHHARDLRTHVTALPLPQGRIPQTDGLETEHVAVADGRLTPDLARQVLAHAGPEVVVTPWRSLLLPDLEPA